MSTLDGFTSQLYVKTLPSLPPGQQDYNFQQLPPLPQSPPRPLGLWRLTRFTAGPLTLPAPPWSQPGTLYVGNGILIVNAGLNTPSAVQVLYGNTPLKGDTSPGSSDLQGPPVPLHLNLSKNSAFQFGFAGISTSESLNVTIELVGADRG
jgi:hypothetical protein